MQLLLVVALLFALAVAVFAVQNAEDIVVQLFTFEFETSLVIVVLAAAAAGALTAGIIGIVRNVRSAVRGRQLQGQVTKLERQVHDLEERLATAKAKVAPREAPVLAANHADD